jgi:hypothetical protein
MKTSNRKEPQVNPPKMASHDLSDAEMEIREMIAKRERGDTIENQNLDSTNDDPTFHINARKEENFK